MLRKVLSIVLSIFLIFYSSLHPLPLQAQENEVYNLAVLNLDAVGISESEASTLSDNMRVQIIRLINSGDVPVKYTILERSKMDKILEQFAFQNLGCTDLSCAVEFGKMLNVERILIGSIGLVGETYTINISMIDVESSRTLDASEYKTRGARDKLLDDGIPQVVREILIGSKKKSRLWWYVGGAAIISGAIAVAMMGGSDDASTTGIVNITIPDPTE